MRRALSVWLLAALLLSGACAMRAETELKKLKVGMTQAEVEKVLGKPVSTKCVRFPAYQRDYLVWEYMMVPERKLVCPSEGAARILSGVATLGLSEIAWTRAQAKPHWVYFLDGIMVYAGLGFDCSQPNTCTIHKQGSDVRCR